MHVFTAVLAALPCWLPPVHAPVVDPFRAPECPYCPGNRGLEYATRDGQPVLAAAAGVVSFSGLVAGTRYVVVEHADGLRVTYGRLVSAAVGEGAQVRQGQLIGLATEQFLLGVRRGDEYLDPAPYLGTILRRARLVPVDGTPPRPGRPPVLVCPAERASR
jgi:murein DD-endopeptidase MepM/ murein hydrolase activator NlpD